MNLKDTKASRRAVIISYAPITDAPRVRRQALVLRERGWQVLLAGRAGRADPPEGCEVLELERVFRMRTIAQRAFHAAVLALSRFSGRLAEWSYWQNTIVRNNFEQLEGVAGDLVLCHDYITVPAALRVAARTGAPVLLDAHEYARGQYMERFRWRYVRRPWIHSLQRSLFPRLDGITTVCDGIADLLQKDNALAERPTVVRSTPPYEACSFRATGDVVTVLYHGIVAPTRGIELALRSVPMWRPEFRLVIRGPVTPDYKGYLCTLARELGVESRVSIEDPVLFGDLIARANEADIGYFVQGDWSPQKRLTLPNKFFEYMMAGLALCVSDLPEMARLVREHGVGDLVHEATPERIAQTINAFDRTRIDAYKKASLAAAEQLCWENECERFATLVERVVGGHGRVGTT